MEQMEVGMTQKERYQYYYGIAEEDVIENEDLEEIQEAEDWREHLRSLWRTGGYW